MERICIKDTCCDCATFGIWIIPRFNFWLCLKIFTSFLGSDILCWCHDGIRWICEHSALFSVSLGLVVFYTFQQCLLLLLDSTWSCSQVGQILHYNFCSCFENNIMWICRVLHKHLPDCLGQVKSQIRASILKDKKISIARIGQAKSVLWTYNFQRSGRVVKHPIRLVL